MEKPLEFGSVFWGERLRGAAHIYVVTRHPDVGTVSGH